MTCQCSSCQTVPHTSSCAVHNEPAMRNGPCSCRSWIIIRTAFKQELKVCRQIEALGYPVWCPMEVRFHRITPGAKTKRAHTWETPILATVLFCSEDYLNSPRRTDEPCEPWVWNGAIPRISPDQITAFKNMADRENAMRKRQHARHQDGKRGRKMIVKLDEHGLKALMKELFGLEVPEMQEAA